MISGHDDHRIPKEQLAEWLKRVRAARSDQDREQALVCYFETVLPDVLRNLENVPRHQALREEKTHTLISLMGFSPETTVISTTVVRPQRLIVIYGAPDDEDERRKVEFSYEIAHKFLTFHEILRGAQIHQHVINPIMPIDIYKVIREAIEHTPTINDCSSALVDITGGKKVMSATAGQAAWEARLPLLYVEGKYDANLRRPWPGTETVMKLDNPSQQEQSQMRIDALSLYVNRNYPLAVDAFERCEANRTENRLDVLAGSLCRAYVRWTDLDLPRLQQDVTTVIHRLNEPRIVRLFQDRQHPRSPFLDRLATLRQVANAEPFALIATFQELAQLYQSNAFQRFDFACLLVYRAMEATVEWGLRQLAGVEFDLRDPDWSKLGAHAELEAAYVALSAKVDSKRSAEVCLPKDIGFVNGVALLCIGGQLHEAAAMRAEDLTNKMRSVARKRNESVLAHGSRTLSASDYHEMKEQAEALTRWVLRDRFIEVAKLRENLAPIDLNPLHDPSQY